MTVYFLVLVFSFSTGYAGGLGSSAIPEPYASHEACVAAAEAAKKDYTGRDYVNWTCVPHATP